VISSVWKVVPRVAWCLVGCWWLGDRPTFRRFEVHWTNARTVLNSCVVVGDVARPNSVFLQISFSHKGFCLLCFLVLESIVCFRVEDYSHMQVAIRYLALLLSIAVGAFTAYACGDQTDNNYTQLGCQQYFSSDCLTGQICERDVCYDPPCGEGYITFCVDVDYYCYGPLTGCFNYQCA